MTRKPNAQRHRSPNFKGDGPTQLVSLKVTTAFNTELAYFAAELSISKSEFIRRAVVEAIQKERLNES